MTVTSAKTGVAIPTTSNTSGVYLFPSLQPGVYRITAERQGFRKHVVNEVTLSIGDKLAINLPMEVGAVADSVEVSAQNEALATNTASVAGTITGRSVQQLPLISRDALGLVTTQAGHQRYQFQRRTESSTEHHAGRHQRAG